ncbi:prepilin-type N-terminal cleavage/methylation domain-containing protein, partial [Pelagibacteraceae bacterium]|nr:prepilin-type N-terminal cleavage/methylation domain-containing protein [Pelagibacteraceae bacterium]
MTRAFTLIELLVVVAIIGILAAVGVTTFNG